MGGFEEEDWGGMFASFVLFSGRSHAWLRVLFALQLPRTILTIQDEPPNWPDDSEYDMGLESVSEPDEIDIEYDDEDGGLEEQFDKLDVNDGEGRDLHDVDPEDSDEDTEEESDGEKREGKQKSRGTKDEDEEDDDDDDDDSDEGEEQFFDTRSGSSVSAGRMSRSRSGASDASTGTTSTTNSNNRDLDNTSTEEEGNDPVTPGPNARFDMVRIREGERTRKATIKGVPVAVGVGKERGGSDGEGDIEDDWVEPSLTTPMPDRYGRYAPSPSSREKEGEGDSFTMVSKPTGEAGASAGGDDGDDGFDDFDDLAGAALKTPTPASTPVAPPVKKSKSKSTKDKEKEKDKEKRKKKKQMPVPVPMARTSSKSKSKAPAVVVQEQVHYPFPVTPGAGGEEEDKEDEYELSYSYSASASEGAGGDKVRRMHTARARDGGRTQSGGVKGILAEDLA